MEIRVTRARRIYSDGKHNAFTGITGFAGKTYVTFRSATTHVSPDGSVKVIASTDADAWDLVAESVEPGSDLRDPKIVAFQDALFVYTGSTQEGKGRQSQVFASTDGVTFGERRPAAGIPEDHWLWWVKPFDNVLYGAAYGTGQRPCTAALYKSTDGLAWDHVCDFPVPGNEVSFDFDSDGKLWALAREDTYGSVPALCTAAAPYTSFDSVRRLPIRLQGPMLARLGGGCAIACRQWNPPGRRNLRTDLFWLPDGRDLQLVRSLPSGGDTSYAGWLDVAEGAALLSYYSSHEHKMDEPHANSAAFAKDAAHAEHSTPADIFLADISYA